MPGIDSNVKLCIVSNSTDGNTDFYDTSVAALTIVGGSGVAHEVDYYFYSPTSIYFPGSAGAYLSTSIITPLIVGIGDFSLEFLIKPTTTSFGVLFDAFYPTGDAQITVTYYNGTLRALLTANVNSTYDQIILEDTVTHGNAYHICVERVDGEITLYTGGVVQQQYSGVLEFDFTCDSGDIDLAIGCSFGGTTSDTYTGYLDQIVFSDIARYDGAFTPPNTPYANGPSEFSSSVEPPLVSVESEFYTPLMLGGDLIAPLASVFSTFVLPFYGTINAPLVGIASSLGNPIYTSLNSKRPIIASTFETPISYWGRIKPTKIDLSASISCPRIFWGNIIAPKVVLNSEFPWDASIIATLPIVASTISVPMSLSGDVVARKPVITSALNSITIFFGSLIRPKSHINSGLHIQQTEEIIKYRRDWQSRL